MSCVRCSSLMLLVPCDSRSLAVPPRSLKLGAPPQPEGRRQDAGTQHQCNNIMCIYNITKYVETVPQDNGGDNPQVMVDRCKVLQIITITVTKSKAHRSTPNIQCPYGDHTLAKSRRLASSVYGWYLHCVPGRARRLERNSQKTRTISTNSQYRS